MTTKKTASDVAFQIQKVAFELGQVVATPGAIEHLSSSELVTALTRHHQCDWGECCAEDWALNDQSVLGEGRLLSVYRTESGVKFWIITEWDRSLTTVLLPDEY